jgi:hypothetical protein
MKNPATKYFKERNEKSIERGRFNFFLNKTMCSLAKYSDKNPMGQIQLQNPFFTNRAVAQIIKNRINPDG